MSVRRVPFHVDTPTSVLLPALLDESGNRVSLATYQSITLVTVRDDHDPPGETTTLGATPPVGITAGTLFINGDPANGELGLIPDTAYFTGNVSAKGVIYKDGADYPQDGYLILQPQGL